MRELRTFSIYFDCKWNTYTHARTECLMFKSKVFHSKYGDNGKQDERKQWYDHIESKQFNWMKIASCFFQNFFEINIRKHVYFGICFFFFFFLSLCELRGTRLRFPSLIHNENELFEQIRYCLTTYVRFFFIDSRKLLINGMLFGQDNVPSD